MAASNTTVLISGAGVAGPSVAFWLRKYGYCPTIVESAPALRVGGYMVDFWGVGYDVAERMGLIPTLRRSAYDIREVRLVDERGNRLGGFSVDAFRAATGGRFFSIQRSDLARDIFEALEGRVETIFGDSMQSLEQDESGVQVTFRHAPARRFDLVIGADGLHSVVRALAFGAESQFEKFLGFYVAAFTSDDYPNRDEDAYVSYTTPGRQVARYALRGGRSAFFLIWREDANLKLDHHDVGAQKQLARDRFRGLGWECQAILAVMDRSDDFYFDAASQIRMDRWSSNRVVLIGDAAFCPSLLAGQGSAFAMAGGHVLADALRHAGGNHVTAFRLYEQRLRPFIEAKQRGAEHFGGWFAPKTRLGLIVRNQLTALMSVPLVGHWMVNQMFGDSLVLPDAGVEKSAA